MFLNLATIISSENLFNNTVHLLEYFLHFLTKAIYTGLNFISFNFPYLPFLSPLIPNDKIHTCRCMHTNEGRSKNPGHGTSLVVQWLRLHASNAGGAGSIPDRGAKIPHASRPKNQNIKQKQSGTQLHSTGRSARCFVTT